MKYYTKEWHNNKCTPMPVINDDNYIEIPYVLGDCQILSDNNFWKKGEKLELILDNSGGFTDIDKIEFTDYSVLEKSDVHKAYIVQEEIYKVKRGFEFHLLLYHYGDLEYFTIFSKSIIFHFDNSDKCFELR